ncbi:hypothetical protein FisN_10Lh188 [Fistulifera solaris]|uniref:Uncharacterized protein n=1 Tax=Fistulifera solaris TaxID=1519565 RepID=A0A1Z5JTF3_FISSO|nr:hypothetical protein FisN_10Lh188 [Fistulifera solaris]|eukprot:GAX17323.1 hypothetical protein FisN_10Lh188 [Fistulifera solaris]
MTFLRSFAVFTLFALSSVHAFAPVQSARPATVLHSARSDEASRKAMTSVVAAAYLMSNIVAAAPAFAWDGDFAGSSQVIAGRSGGRSGGRAKAPSRAPTRVVERQTTIVQPSPVIVSPGYGYGYGYNPNAGLGLALGINAIGSISEGMREYRQESEIRDARSELQQAKLKEAELEMRLRQLEQRTAAQ